MSFPVTAVGCCSQRWWLSFLAAPEMIGVTSMCRFWRGDERVYHRLLHFFRPGLCLWSTLDAWQHNVLSQEVTVEVKGRCVLLGDHTHVVKDGGRMPGVVSLRETSETQHRPSYFRGQCWGAVGLVVGSLRACFCSPLELRIHQGFCHQGHGEPGSTRQGPSLAERVVHMALRFAVGHDCPAFWSWMRFSPGPLGVFHRLATTVSDDPDAGEEPLCGLFPGRAQTTPAPGTSTLWRQSAPDGVL
ncbi:MAG: hypothetical protein R3F37_18290 [Candidatus Competibacteraceae bacterium]